MDKLECVYEAIFEVLTGLQAAGVDTAWVGNIAVEGTPYNDAYELLWDSREKLAKRFDLDIKDEDLDNIMDAVLRIEMEVGWHSFLCGMEYAKRHLDR